MKCLVVLAITKTNMNIVHFTTSKLKTEKKEDK